MTNNGITFYKTDPIYTNGKFNTHAFGEKGYFTNDEKKTIGLTGKEIDNNFLTLEGRDIFNFYFDDFNNLVIETLNGKKYLLKTERISQQSDWETKDASSISYIRNKPSKLSDFINDGNFTNTTFTSFIPEDDNSYEIGVITINGVERKINGKLIGGSHVITKAPVFSKNIGGYIINITDEMFTEGYVSHIIVNQFETDKGFTDASVFFGGDVFPLIKLSTGSVVTAMNATFTLPGFPNNTLFFKYPTKYALYFTCFTERDGKKYMFVDIMEEMKEEPKENPYVEITNNCEGITVNCGPLISTLFPTLNIEYGQTSQISAIKDNKISFSSLSSDGATKVPSNWTIVSSKGETREEIGVMSINVSIDGNYSVFCKKYEKAE